MADHFHDLLHGKRIGQLIKRSGTGVVLNQNRLCALGIGVAKNAVTMAPAEPDKKMAFSHIGPFALDRAEYFRKVRFHGSAKVPDKF